MTENTVVTFDLFSALLDSRAGGAAVFGHLAEAAGWSPSGTEIYDTWDALNKTAQRDCRDWVPYVDLAASALARCYERLGIVGRPEHDWSVVLESMSDWPLWPDVAEVLPQLATRYRIGVLSNVDTAVFARTRAARFFEAEHVFTSERLGVYKPNPAIYDRAQQACSALVHVASSARDVRGALESGIPVIRLRRDGHQLDPAGPTPSREAASMADLQTLLADF
ncbi:haloacid dehalogenase [Cryobacterium levicorallinum]|uniref:Haloacid dehalogenase n=1 Tax=Cryobacterium levicorallinum TaxID=995038 RepID=A0A1I3AP51_9MICO|nr:HAD-IA family hydrolase [Cryobacterium levicorallinum]TFB88054.1 haloacid dehalogenase [Cryobacterium levicorallinum]GEP26747.1 hypothetical protein CLE01_13450 [Cryobacterium levicorallinum]SFH51938.1 2-haloacid dehalogenase [Cryobacterium levicorallinum]